MSNFTIEELKSILQENGIALPSGRPKKEDYLKLYDEHLVLNSSLGETYASDDEGSQNSRRVTSTNGENGKETFEEFVEKMSNDDLFNSLKELDFDPGPILSNTRKVYEKKFIQLFREDAITNNGHDNNLKVDIAEISDNEIEIPVRNLTPQPGTSKREPSREPSIVKTSLQRNSREPSIQRLNATREESIPRRVTYIEKIPRGSSQRIIETVDSSDIRQRYTVDAGGDRYVGRWSPKLATRFTTANEDNVPEKNSKTIIIIIVLMVILLAIAAYVYTGLPATTDQYELVENDAERHTKSKIDN